MKRCPHCGVQDHDDAILCKSCMRSFSAPPERKATPQAQRTGSPLRLLLTLLVLGAIGFAVMNPEQAQVLISQGIQLAEEKLAQATEEPSSAEAEPQPAAEAPAADTPAPAPAPAPPEDPPRPAESPVALTPDRTTEPRPSAPPPASPRAAPRRPDPRPAESRPVEEPRPEPTRPARPAVAETPSAPAPPPPASQPVRVGGNIKAPTKVRDVRPVYPAVALASKVQGIVIIEATIGPNGRVRETRVLRGVPLLDDAALDAVRQWEYEPTLLNGVPVPVIMTVTVNFRLQ